MPRTTPARRPLAIYNLETCAKSGRVQTRQIKLDEFKEIASTGTCQQLSDAAGSEQKFVPVQISCSWLQHALPFSGRLFVGGKRPIVMQMKLDRQLQDFLGDRLGNAEVSMWEVTPADGFPVGIAFLFTEKGKPHSLPERGDISVRRFCSLQGVQVLT
jgi:hypothetical protein